MKLVKKLNAVFISFIVGILYVFIIGFAWLIHICTKRVPIPSDSYWHIPEKNKLPKQYFSSPY